jgi:uncharacterized SAM-binding protein YcdF (DUF218 family)
MFDVGFFIKKIITFFIEPYGAFLLLLLLGIFFLYKSKIKLAKSIFISLFFVMYLLAYPPFSNFLVENLENDYVKYNYQIKDIKYIHVLGNGHIEDKNQPI